MADDKNTPVPPPLTNEARKAALEKAIDIRKRQAAFKKELKQGQHAEIRKTLEMCLKDDALCRLKVITFLESLPTVGKTTAKSLMREMGIAESRRLQGLGPQQRHFMCVRLVLIPGIRSSR